MLHKNSRGAVIRDFLGRHIEIGDTVVVAANKGPEARLLTCVVTEIEEHVIWGSVTSNLFGNDVVTRRSFAHRNCVVIARKAFDV